MNLASTKAASTDTPPCWRRSKAAPAAISAPLAVLWALLSLVGCANPPSDSGSAAGGAGSAGASSLAASSSSGGGAASGGAGPVAGGNSGGPVSGPVVASGVPVSIDLQPFTPGFSVQELRAPGVLDLVGPFPLRYRIDFCAPPDFASACPAPIIGSATGPKVKFVAPFLARPATNERFVIDVVVTVLDGPNAGQKLRDRTGLVVNPSGADSGLRGDCGVTAPVDAR